MKFVSIGRIWNQFPCFFSLCKLSQPTGRFINILFYRNITSSLKMSAKVLNRVAVCQMKATNDKTSNLHQVKDLIKRSIDQGASFVFFPECCDFIGENRAETLKLSEDLGGETVQTYKSLAKEYNVWLSMGGLHETIFDKEDGIKDNRIYNCHILINNQGDLVASYRKLHMFDVDTPEFKFRESEIVKKGPGIVLPVDTPIGSMGLQICYDLRFSEVSTFLRLKGAKILTYPSAFAYTTGLAHWEILLRARAIENQCYVIAAAQIGFHNTKRRSYGHALIVDPWGKVIAECSEAEQDVAIADIDLTEVDRVRKNMPCEEHRCNDTYSLVPLKIAGAVNNVEFYNFGGHKISKDTVFYETLHSFAFTNIRCVVPGHILVATKRSAKRLTELNPEEVADFFNVVKKIQEMLEKYYCSTSSTITVQDGEDAGQTVSHVHCHIMPRTKGDFEFNDMIYVELNKHDSPNVKLPQRALSEMIEEAKKYKPLLLK